MLPSSHGLDCHGEIWPDGQIEIRQLDINWRSRLLFSKNEYILDTLVWFLFLEHLKTTPPWPRERGRRSMYPLQWSTWQGKPVARGPFCLHHSCTTLSSCENRWKKWAKSPKVIDDTSSFPSLKSPPLLQPSRSKVFDKAIIKGNFTYLLFKTAHETNFYLYRRGCKATPSEKVNWLIGCFYQNMPTYA